MDEKPDSPDRYEYCEQHDEVFDSHYWSCCEKCWNSLTNPTKEM